MFAFAFSIRNIYVVIALQLIFGSHCHAQKPAHANSRFNILDADKDAKDCIGLAYSSDSKIIYARFTITKESDSIVGCDLKRSKVQVFARPKGYEGFRQATFFCCLNNIVFYSSNSVFTMYSKDHDSHSEFVVHPNQLAFEKPQNTAVSESRSVIITAVAYASSILIQTRSIDDDKPRAKYKIETKSTGVMAVTEKLLLVSSNRMVDKRIQYAIELWDFTTGKLLLTRVGHDDNIKCCAFNRDGSLFATTGTDGKMIVWESSTGKVMLSYQTKRTVSYVDFHPDGDQLLACAYDFNGDPNLFLGSVKQKKIKFSWPASKDGLYACQFAPDGKSFATVDAKGILQTWSLP